MQHTTITNNTLTIEQHDALLAQVNPEKIIKDSQEKIENAVMESSANERASKEPIPSIVNEAFIDNDIIIKTSIGDVKIRKLKAIDITIFKLTDSPFYKLMMGDIEEGAIKTIFPEEELLFNLVYQFTHDVKEVYTQVKKDKNAYHNMVIEQIGFIYEPSDILLLTNAILTHVGLVNKGRADYSAAPILDDDKKKV